ncbi:hypothetical protein DQ04_03011040 [Trypanosoma grayi]|uniref:hypothetical protein n=1 Tax=Trypanosoma grayi TaxID=71804 RepID=UPI0004F4BCB7|nr:hypothetical protein DQ04_03011040 [Trypanosoma grayi]KEG11071.1 hypothetical protein DQ04_03011040 [Trypanosoma grayi]
MDFYFHLINRRDVVVIFVDMDSSIFLTDYALPHPLGPPGDDDGNTIKNDTSIQSVGLGGEEAVDAATPPKKNDVFTPARTRYEVIWQALRSFILQKQRVSPNASTSLWFALYTILDEVTEVLPPTSGDSGAIESAIKSFVRANADMAARRTRSSEPFPFRSVATVLRRIEESFAELGSGPSGSTDMATGSAMESKSGPSFAAGSPHVANKRTLTAIQGIVLLNRDSAPPSSQIPPDAVDGELLGTGAIIRRCIDIIPLGNLRHPLPLVKMMKERAGTNSRYGEAANSSRDPIAAKATAVDCPCTSLDLESFTGISHRGLAVGCALTKLIGPHNHKNEDFFYAQPICRVNLPVPVKAPSRQQQQQQPATPKQQQLQQQQEPHKQRQQPQLDDGASWPGIPLPTKAKAETPTRRTSLDTTPSASVKTTVTPVATSEPLAQSSRPPMWPVTRESNGSLNSLCGAVYTGRTRTTGKPEAASTSSKNSSLSGVAAGNLTAPSSAPPSSCIRGVIIERHLAEGKK